MSSMVWANGRLVSADDALVPYDDHGITVGDGVFETVKLSDGVPFAITRHLHRLARSAEAMAITMPPPEVLTEVVEAVCGAATTDEGFLRITLTAGPGPLGSNRGDLRPNLIVAIRPGTVRLDPTDVLLVDWRRNERGALAGIKSTSYGENVMALVAADRAGATEALFANTVDELCEGTGSNVFVGFGDRLLTPPLASGCLAGVTRELLLEAGIGEESTIPLGDLAGATEMFLTSTGREVQPVRAVIDTTGTVTELPWCSGPLTVAARRAWVETIAPRSDP
ncbi:MAG: aminotransferase class IV [Acidimicrobiales bacterium]